MVASWAGSGWIVGLVSNNWIADQPSHVPIWGHLILVIFGPWMAAFTIGVATASITVGIVTFFHQLVSGRTALHRWPMTLAATIALPSAAIAASYVLPFAAKWCAAIGG
jgi:hypothetical protein